jgi:hypothetical protein
LKPASCKKWGRDKAEGVEGRRKRERRKKEKERRGIP